MLNHTSKGSSAVFEIAIGVAIILGVGLTAHSLQHTPERTHAAMQASQVSY